MSRRPVVSSRSFLDDASIPFGGTVPSKPRQSSLLPIVVVVVGAFLIIGYVYSGSGGGNGDKDALNKLEGGISCALEVQRSLPALKKSYGDSMHKVLHIGPDTCSVVSALLKEDDTEAWGVEPYDLDDVDRNCKSLTLPELARVSRDGLVIFSGYPGQRSAKVAELSKFGRPAKKRSPSWWIKYFVDSKMKENGSATKKFEQAAAKDSYEPACQVFHLKSHH